MRPFIFILLMSLPCTAGATIAAPSTQGETAIAQQAISHGFAPKKQRFFERVTAKILAKRIHKALKRNDGKAAKVLSVSGFTCSALGVFIFFNSPGAALILLAAGLVLCILGLVLSSSATEKWVKYIAIAGIVPPIILGLLILIWQANVSDR